MRKYREILEELRKPETQKNDELRQSLSDELEIARKREFPSVADEVNRYVAAVQRMETAHLAQGSMKQRAARIRQDATHRILVDGTVGWTPEIESFADWPAKRIKPLDAELSEK